MQFEKSITDICMYQSLDLSFTIFTSIAGHHSYLKLSAHFTHAQQTSTS